MKPFKNMFAQLVVAAILTATLLFASCTAQAGAIEPDKKGERSSEEIEMAQKLLENLKELALSSERHLDGRIAELFGIRYDIRTEERKTNTGVVHYRKAELFNPSSSKFDVFNNKSLSRYFDEYGDLDYYAPPQIRAFHWGSEIEKSKLCITTDDVRKVFEQDARFNTGPTKWPGEHYASDTRWSELQKRGGEWWGYEAVNQIGRNETRKAHIQFAYWSCASGFGLIISVLK